MPHAWALSNETQQAPEEALEMRVEYRKLAVNPCAPEEKEAMILVPETEAELETLREAQRSASSGMRVKGKIQVYLSDTCKASCVSISQATGRGHDGPLTRRDGEPDGRSRRKDGGPDCRPTR